MFDQIAIVDWSGGNDRGAKPKPDAIWACTSNGEPYYLRNRHLAEDWLIALIETALATDNRLLIGFDFPFGYPNGFSEHVCGSSDPLDLWAWFAGQITDSPKANNRFDVAGSINQTLSDIGPFWGNGLRRDIDGLPRKGRDVTNATYPNKRTVEAQTKGTFTCWQMSGAGSVGGQIMMGLPVLHRLRMRFGTALSVWPFQPSTGQVVLAEVWPSLHTGPVPDGMIKDAHQTRSTVQHFASLSADELASLFQAPDIAAQEGWILGVRPATNIP